jgi:hypothetical protein
MVAMPESYVVKVLGPLPTALAALGCLRTGVVEARTVLRMRDPAPLATVVTRLSALGLELSEVHRGPGRSEVEVRGLIGPAVQAALSDVAVSMSRRRCVLFLGLPGRRLGEVLQALTDNGVDLLSIRGVALAAETS